MKMAAESTMLFCNTSQEKPELWSYNYFNTALEKVKLHSKLYIKATGAKHFYLGRVLLFTWLADIYVVRFKSVFENWKKILFLSKFNAEISIQTSQLYQWEYIVPTSKDDVTDKRVLWNVYRN